MSNAHIQGELVVVEDLEVLLGVLRDVGIAEAIGAPSVLLEQDAEEITALQLVSSSAVSELNRYGLSKKHEITKYNVERISFDYITWLHNTISD
eukprot:2789088-Amphidinium_carterae.1